MDVLGSTGSVLLNLARTQFDEQRQVNALASGLRVQSAADNPSGYAIAQTIQTRVSGLQQGVQNVQAASNLLNVADATMAGVQAILQRIHTLIVQSRSDLQSNNDLQNIQTEISQLLNEIDKIASDAQFNGLQLFGGQFDNTAAIAPSVTIVPSQPNADGSAPSPNVTNADGFGNPGPLVSNLQPPIAGISIPALMEYRVVGYANPAIDPDSGTNVGPGVYLQLIAYSTAGASFGAGPQMVDTAAVPVNIGPISGVTTPTPSGGGTLLQNYTIANLTASDVGTAMTIVTSLGKAAGTGTALTVNSGGQEGSTVSIGIPTLSTSSLGVAGISVLPPTVVNFNNQVTGSSSSNQYAASYAEIAVQNAIAQLSQQRAQIGAQTVMLQEDAGDASTQIVNQVAAISAIRDTNIGAAVTALTKDQILNHIGTSVLAQMQGNAHLVVQLVGRSFARAPVRG